MTTENPPSLPRLRQLAELAGTPRVQMQVDLRTSAVSHVGVDWDDKPDVVTRCTRAGALVALVSELRGTAA